MIDSYLSVGVTMLLLIAVILSSVFSEEHTAVYNYRFYEELLNKIFDTEAALHNVEDPLEIAIGVMKAACDLYDADWSGILIADLHSQLWRPEVWYHDVKVVDAKTGVLYLSDDVRITTDAQEMKNLYYRAISTANEEEKTELLKKAFDLYKGRVFEDGEAEIGTWLIEHMTHYNQILINTTKELFQTLSHKRDDNCSVEYAARAIRSEPGIQDAYYWMIEAANHMGNSAARDKSLIAAREALRASKT